MKNRGLSTIVFTSLIASSAFADSLSDPILNALSSTLTLVATVVGSIVAITLVSLTWVYVSMAIWRSGRVRDDKIYSDLVSRTDAKERLSSHGFGEKELNLKSYRNGVKADKFRKKFATFEDWENSSDFRKAHRENVIELNNHEMNFERHYLYKNKI